jgi:hypothetical protein
VSEALAAPGVAMDHDQMTIEHIAPQSPTAGTNVSAEDLAKLGNLLWCDGPLQEKLKNKPFAEKKALLKKHPVPGSSEITTQDDWGTAEIDARTEHLAELAYNEVWK